MSSILRNPPTRRGCSEHEVNRGEEPMRPHLVKPSAHLTERTKPSIADLGKMRRS